MADDHLPSWFNTPDLMQVIIVLLFGAFIWFAIRTLQQIDRNQCEMFRRMTRLERDFYILRGQCGATHNRRWEDIPRQQGDGE